MSMGKPINSGVSVGDCLVVLRDLVNTVEATGGLVRWSDGAYTPECDHEWDDLGRVAFNAAGVLVRAGRPVELRIQERKGDREP